MKKLITVFILLVCVGIGGTVWMHYEKNSKITEDYVLHLSAMMDDIEDESNHMTDLSNKYDKLWTDANDNDKDINKLDEEFRKSNDKDIQIVKDDATIILRLYESKIKSKIINMLDDDKINMMNLHADRFIESYASIANETLYPIGELSYWSNRLAENMNDFWSVDCILKSDITAYSFNKGLVDDKEYKYKDTKKFKQAKKDIKKWKAELRKQLKEEQKKKGKK